VLKIIGAGPAAGKCAVIFAGTGPVGVRAAALLAAEGCQVLLTSRILERAEKACQSIRERFGLEVTPAEVREEAGVERALQGAQIALACGAAGIELVRKELWAASPTMEVVADVNAVPPTGIGGIKPGDDGKLREGKLAFGALGIGSLKMKIHRAAVARLFAQNDLVLDIEQIYSIGKAL
jgi:NAD(P)-dependent dehydrogenase (short-subunit alcohol dehydrogenase family)